jgi:hypothetical protein
VRLCVPKPSLTGDFAPLICLLPPAPAALTATQCPGYP